MKLNIALSLLLISAGLVLAEQPAPQASSDSSTATLKVSSRLTLENVTVTDAAGKPVLGLKQSDFTVKEDGKPQNIKNFEEFGTEQTEAQAAPPQLPPNVYTNQQTAARTAVNILLIDDVTTGMAYHLEMAPRSQIVVRQQAIKYLNTIPPGTQVAILKMANELSVVQGFTSDRNVLLAAIDSLRPKLAAQTYATTPAEVCNAANSQSDITIAALAAVANFSSGIKGRKNLIWFTPGIPWLTNYHRYSYSACLIDYTSELQRAYGLLTAAQVAVYPVDPQGTNYCEYPVPHAPRPECDLNLLLYDHESELDIANATGGVAYYNRNDLDAAIGEAIANGAHSYSLSYEPPPSKNDKFHKVEIAVDRPGLHLRYREGYTDIDLAKPVLKKKDSESAPDSDFHIAVDQGVIPSTGLLFGVRVAPSTAQAMPGDPPVAGMLNPRLKGKPLVRYVLMYEVPPGEIALVDGPDGTRKGSLEFDVVAYGVLAYGEDRTKLNVVRKTVNFTLKPSEVEHFVKNPILMPVQIDLPPGKVDLHAGVLDVSSQKMGTLEITEPVTQR